MSDFWKQFGTAAPQAYNQSAALYARREQEEEQRKYQEEQQEAARLQRIQDKKDWNEWKAEQKKQADAVELQELQGRLQTVSQRAQSFFAPLVQQGLMTPQDVQNAQQHIMTQKDTDAAWDTMRDWQRKYKPSKSTKPAKPSADEKFNYVMKAYFAGQGEQLSPAQWNTFRKALPEGMKDIPLTPPEGVTSVGGLRKHMKEQKKQQEMTEKMEEAKRVWRAERKVEEGKRARSDKPDEYNMLVPDFDEWIREPGQIKKYGSAYTTWRKQQLQEQIARAAGRSPSKEAGFSPLPTDRAGQQMMQYENVPPATAMPQGTPQVAPPAQQERMATQEQINAIQQLEEQMRALEASLR